MIPLPEGPDYLIYRFYIWGGMVVLIIFSLIMAFSDIPGTGNL